MTGRFPYRRLAKYPHLKPEDIAVWERFIDANPGVYETCDYDVPVGKGAETDPAHPPEIQRDHTILTQKKIDVVAYYEDVVHVIELKPIANARALGQILVYKRLYSNDHPDVALIVPTVICGAVEREMQDDFDAAGVVVKIA